MARGTDEGERYERWHMTGHLVFDTELDANGFQTGANKLNNLVSGLGIFKLLEKGFQMVANSVDKAMGRIDTMEQFSRVMTTMTGDVSATNEALAETTEIVSGTAYGLDYAARAVQNFTSRGMEISKSTETVRAGRCRGVLRRRLQRRFRLRHGRAQ